MGKTPLVFINIGWMRLYNGPRDDDPTRGNFGFLKNQRHGHECFNFSPFRRRFLGYMPGEKGIDINNLGAKRSATFIDGVCVVWIARDPRTNKTVIVGWYKNARVYRHRQTPQRGDGHELDGAMASYVVEAKSNDGSLLPVNNRTFPIPSRSDKKGGYGQSPVWYGLNDAFREQVLEYIDNPQRKRKASSKSPGRNQNIELRQKIERVAVQHAIDFYESDEGGNYQVDSVEKESKGWDLEVARGSEILRIEVKGKSADEVSAELTPNEYSKMYKHYESYVVYIVTGCLGKKPKAHIFRYMHDSEEWETEDGRILAVDEKVAAVIRCLV